jgi:hypothetical protein
MSGLGLIPAIQTMSNVKDERFLQVGQPIVAPTLVEPVVIQAQDKSTSGIIYVDPLASGTYQGAITLNPGVNSTSTTRGAGITVRTGAGPSTIIDVGTNTQANNILNISGTSGSSRVYDEKYNPTVSIKNITKTATDATLVPRYENEIAYGGQTAIAKALVAPPQVFNKFTVPKSGYYQVLTECALINGAGAVSVVLPAGVSPGGAIPAGVSYWGSWGFSIGLVGGSVLPYCEFEYTGGEFSALELASPNSIITKAKNSIAYFDANEEYDIILFAGATPAGLNIGQGYVKAELIAMC